MPDESGSFWGGETVAQGNAEVGFTVEAVGTFEDLMWWLLLALDGDIPAVSDAGTPPAYTREAVPVGNADNLKTATFEYGFGTLVYRSTMVGVRRLTLSVNRADANTWRMTADCFARDITKISNFTAAIPERAREAIPAAGTHLFLDPAGTLGTTEVLNKWRSFSVTVENNPDFKRFGEGDVFVSPDFGRGDQTVTGEVVLEQVDDTEYEFQRLATGRGLRLERESDKAPIHTTVRKRARIDLPNLYWNAPAEQILGQNVAQSFGFVAKPYIGAAPISIETVNALASMP